MSPPANSNVRIRVKLHVLDFTEAVREWIEEEDYTEL
jgi:hypothetical protein